MTTYIIGHRNPDTDSICSAIGYAHLKQALGEQVVAGRAGKINAETKYVLEYFQQLPPKLIMDLYPRVHDVMQTEFVSVRPWHTLRELGQIMKQHAIKSAPVVEQDGTLRGMMTMGDLAQRYISELEMQDLSQAGVSFAGMLRALDGTLACGRYLERKITGKVRIAAARTQTMIHTVNPNDIVLVGDRKSAQLACIERGAACLVITLGAEVSEQVLELAEKSDVIIMTAPYDTYTCARLMNQSISVQVTMTTDVIAFKPEDFLTEVKNTIIKTHYRHYPVVEDNKVVGFIDRDQLIVPERKKVILVDHNEQAQAVDGIEDAVIVEIIDHHRLGGLQTSQPIFIRHEPVGSTATIVANMHWHRSVELPPPIAGLLLSGILSDTVLFKSPTSTSYDEETAIKLAGIAGVDMQVYGMEMLRAGSQVGNLSPAEIVHYDLKEFQIGENRVVIGQISVMETNEILGRTQEIITYLENLSAKQQYDMAMLMVTDILQESTDLLFTDKALMLIFNAFGHSGQNRVLHLPGVMSRKQQVVPPLVEAVKKN